MARGGYRPGAGRPKGARSVKAAPKLRSVRKTAGPPRMAALKGRKSPRNYMLDVMNDDTANESRRDRMAIAAAPFMHSRKADDRLGKKDAQQAAADEAGSGRLAPGAPPKLVINN